MEFRYRYVNYGTTFSAAAGMRSSLPQGDTPGERQRDAALLYENELVVDVGGVCWGIEGVELPILDHHFHRERGQFPAAAAAVLHYAPRIAERFREVDAPLWLVTHHLPDFDALCAMYLARGVLQSIDRHCEWSIPVTGWAELGILPEGWQTTDRFTEIDWFRPAVADWPVERRWPVLLAAFASCVDLCKPVACPKNRTLDSILYTALQRGRNYLPNGALEFFDEIRSILHQSTMPNPLFDSVLESSSTFAPELAMLDRELAAYEHDIRRARRTIVYVQRSEKPFQAWYPEVTRQPLINEQFAIMPPHDAPTGRECIPVDAVFLRDPECLLFKNWCRVDRDHSSLGQGFTFTAIAYSGERSGAVLNATDYYFALDPERAIPAGLHLYNVWARLEAEELKALQQSERTAALRESLHSNQPRCRTGFEARASVHGRYFADPWYDGGSYACTIVATPNRGSTIGLSGTDADLGDDPVMRVVLQEVEAAALSGEVRVIDLSTQTNVAKEAVHVDLVTALAAAPRHLPRTYRYAQLALASGVDPTAGQTGEQIGRMLWQLLAGSRSGVPNDFAERHLLVTPASVAVWSRAGIVVAIHEAARDQAATLEQQLRELVEISGQVAALAESQPGDDHALQAAVAQTDDLHRRLTALRQYLSYPEGRLLRRFFEATGLSDFVNTVREVHATRSGALLARRFDANLGYVAGVQNAVEWLEIFIVSFYSIEMTHILGHALHFQDRYVAVGVLVIGVITSVVIARALRPWEHHAVGHAAPTGADDKHGKHDEHAEPFANIHPLGLALIVLAALLAIFVVVGVAFFSGHDTEQEKHNDDHNAEQHAALNEERSEPITARNHAVLC